MQISSESLFKLRRVNLSYCNRTEEISSFRNHDLTHRFTAPFDANLNVLYGLFPSKRPSSLTSTISRIFRRAQRNRVFHVEGSGWSPCRYFPGVFCPAFKELRISLEYELRCIHAHPRNLEQAYILIVDPLQPNDTSLVDLLF